MCNFIKKETPALVVFCEFCEVFKITFHTENFQTTASALLTYIFQNFLLVFVSELEVENEWLYCARTDLCLKFPFFSCFGFQTRSIRSIKVGIVEKPDPNYGPERKTVPLKRNRSKNRTSRR